MLLAAARHKLGVALNAISLKFPLPIEESLHRAGEMGQWLRGLTALPEYLCLLSLLKSGA